MNRPRFQNVESRLARSVGLLTAACVAGVIGYMLLGLSPLDALYQTIITVTTVGYRELGEVGPGYKLFTIVFLFVGVGSALYTLTVLFDHLVEGRLEAVFGRRRMSRDINRLSGHVVLCGAGRVGRVLAQLVIERSNPLVVIDHDANRLTAAELQGSLSVLGDARFDDVLESAGIERATTLITALTNDADNVYVTLAARGLNPDLFIVARAHSGDAEPKLVRAGADRVVNPQQIGGHRMATFALQPNVAEFLDVVMHDSGVEWRLEELLVGEGSALVDTSLGEADLRHRTGVMVLAVRGPRGRLMTNPGAATRLTAGSVVIAMGTHDELVRLEQLMHGG